MKQLLLLLLFPCFALAQYQGNANQKITLGEQTTADGLVWRGIRADTTTKIVPFSDTSAYIILDTVEKTLWLYKAGQVPKWQQVGGSTLDTATMLLPYYRAGRNTIIKAADVPTLNQNTTGSAATLTTGRTIQTNLASTSSASFNGSANITPGVTGTLPVANGGTGTSIGSITGSDSLLFAAGGSNKNIRVTPSGTGNFVVTNGNIVLANNAGIDFGVTTNSSGTMENELLDDYEEGYFTYTMPCSTSGSFTPRSGYLTGYYTKIGRVVNIHVRFESSGRNSPVGSIQLGNLPFTTASDPTNGFGLFIFPVFFQGFNNTGVGSTYFKVFKNDTKGVFTRQSTAGVVDDIVVADITTNIEGSLIFSYVTN